MELTCPMCNEQATVILTWVEDDQARVYCPKHADYMQAISVSAEIRREPYVPAT